jgi:hypothetical protein
MKRRSEAAREQFMEDVFNDCMARLDPFMEAAIALQKATEDLLLEPTLAKTIACSREIDKEFGRACPEYLNDMASIRAAAAAAITALTQFRQAKEEIRDQAK